MADSAYCPPNEWISFPQSSLPQDVLLAFSKILSMWVQKKKKKKKEWAYQGTLRVPCGQTFVAHEAGCDEDTVSLCEPDHLPETHDWWLMIDDDDDDDNDDDHDDDDW